MVLKNKKSLGQHWLTDRFILDAIADDCADGLSAHKLVLEIGPGLGTLTSSLLKRFEKVLAVEYDAHLAENLPKSFPGKNLEVVNADFLNCDLDNLPAPYAVAGNIPYYITSPIISKLLETENPPERIVLLIQKEVAERIVAKDGRRSVLSLSVENRATATLGDAVPKDYFTPPPKVDSQVIILEPHPPLVPAAVIKLIKRGFSSPRKKLISNLGLPREQLLPIFSRLNLSPDIRPADLALGDWSDLANALQTLNC